jgi:hypothetical protein
MRELKEGKIEYLDECQKGNGYIGILTAYGGLSIGMSSSGNVWLFKSAVTIPCLILIQSVLVGAEKRTAYLACK